MNCKMTAPRIALLVACGIACAASYRVGAQQPTSPAQSAAPSPNGIRPGTAPGLKVTDLGRGGRTYRVDMVKGDEIVSGLLDLAEQHHIKNGHFTGLGAVARATLRWVDPGNSAGTKELQFNQEAEIGSLVGSIGTDDQGRPVVHAHMVIGLSDGTARAGHLVSAQVGIIAQIFVTDEEGAAANPRK